jgi:hypothetical protein
VGVEIISVPSEYSNIEILYVVGATNGGCYVVGALNASPTTIVWNGLVYGNDNTGGCNTCPTPTPTPTPTNTNTPTPTPTMTKG